MIYIPHINSKDQTQKLGFEPDECYNRPCMDPSHNPPTHLYIPEGQKYTHVCPSCRFTIVLRSNHSFMVYAKNS